MGVRYVPHPPRTADLVVVGGGIVGAATAFHAVRAGLRTVLLERRPAPASLTTAAAAGGFRLQFDDGLDLGLVRDSVGLFRRFEEVTGQRDHAAGFRERGYLWVTTSPHGAELQRELVMRQRSWGLDDVELVDGDEARRRWPFLGPGVLRARFRQGDGTLDPTGVAMGLLAGSGADVVVGCGVRGFAVRGGRLVGVETERGVLHAERCVIACGPLSGPLARRAGVELPIETVTRHKVVLPDAPEVPADAPMTIDDDTAAHWRPAAGGAQALFTDPAARPGPPLEDVPPDPGFASRVLDPSSPTSVARTVPFWRGVWERGDRDWVVRSGQYTMTPDRRPLIGETDVAGLYVNTGYCGHGVMAGPGGSRHLVELIAGKTEEENPFRLDRTMAAGDRGSLL